MTFDTVIAGGTIVDGSGTPARRGDLAIADGAIAAIGPRLGGARRVIEAGGCVVCPGFIDVHTHLDVQGFWDPTLSPSPLHGVTTVIGGNCGFSVAPIDDAGGDFLMRMLARVEGMPLETLEHAVPWNWRSTADFLAALDGRLAVNSAFMIGHSALRRYVMGQEASERAAAADEVDRMGELLAAGLRAGGLGFSSSWGANHHDGDGAPVPSRFAAADELVRLASVCRDHVGTSIAFSPSAGIGPFTDADVSVMVEMSIAAQRPVNWNLLNVTVDSLDLAEQRLSASDVAASHGAKIVGLVLGHNPGSRYSVLAGVGLDGLPGWSETMALPPAEKLRVLQDGNERARLRALAETTTTMQHHADWGGKLVVEVFEPELKRFEGRYVDDVAAELGQDPFDVFLDLACADSLRMSYKNRARPDTDDDWAARAEVLRDPRAMIGASDAGAHLDMVATFDYPSVLLGEMVRKRRLISIEDGVRMLTGAPAELFGLTGRGVLEPGATADVVVLDPAVVGTADARMRFDLPEGGGRLYNEGSGYRHVLVNGVEIAADGRFTGAAPGKVIRSGRDTRTPALT